MAPSAIVFNLQRFVVKRPSAEEEKEPGSGKLLPKAGKSL